jgi:sugar-specific transcriptional regulator TrmB
MNEDELVTVLKDSGLSPYQAEAYVTLLELGSAPATRVAEASDVPDPRIYDVLRDLESRGFVETYEQDNLHARAHNPGDVLSDLRTQAEQYEAAAEEIEERWSKPSMDQSRVSIVTRFDTVLDHAREYIRGAENQVQLSVTPDHFERLRPALVEAVEAGVIVKLSLHVPEGEPVDVSFDGACTEARICPLPTPFVVIVDRERAAFAPHSSSLNEYGVLVENRSHAYVFYWFFVTSRWDVWDTAYSAHSDDLPRRYINIRYCIRDVAPLFEEGARIEVTVVGSDIETGRSREIKGTIHDVTIARDFTGAEGPIDETLSVTDFAGVARLTIDIGDELVTVGGWGATLEDMEADRTTITGISATPDGQ